jgi:hypothetical protein
MQKHDVRTSAVSTVQEAGWAPGAILDGVRKISPPLGFDPRTIQPVASHTTDWAIPARQKYNTVINTRFHVTLQSNSKYALKHARQPVLPLRKLTLRNLRFCNKFYTLHFDRHAKFSEPDQRPVVI